MSDQARPLSVSEVVGRAKRALEAISVTVLGEVSEYSDKPGYKAVYFSLADGDSVLPCIMWKSEFTASGVVLSEGALVEAVGRLTVYPAKGRMQFKVSRLTMAGEGALRMQVAQLARKLEAEGLMSAARKRSLPVLPERIGLVTSPRGKAVHDVIRTLRRRYPVAEIVLAGVAVEGRAAVQEIVAGLHAVGSAGVDVVVLCRGGGSYEDLMPFNAESVARAVVGCPVPVVTGIGHEPDDSIADMVADVRTSTPTAAAEAVAPTVESIRERLSRDGRAMGGALRHSTSTARAGLDALAARPVLHDPSTLFVAQGQRLDTAADSLARALPSSIERQSERTGSLGSALDTAVGRALERWDGRLGRTGDRLGDLSPLAILERGYAICYDDDGRAVRTAVALGAGDRLDVRFASGRADCTVDSVESEA